MKRYKAWLSLGAVVSVTGFVLSGCGHPQSSNPQPSPGKTNLPSGTSSQGTPSGLNSNPPPAPIIKPNPLASHPKPTALNAVKLPPPSQIKTFGMPPTLPKGEQSSSNTADARYGTGKMIAIPNDLGQGGWGPTKQTPLSIAMHADQTLAGLVDAFSDARVHLVVPQGRGDTTLLSKFGNPGFFHVQFTSFYKDHPANLTIISNGVKRVVIRNAVEKGQSKLVSETPYSDQVTTLSGEKLVNLWPTSMTKYVLAYYRYGQKVYGPMVKSMLSGYGGYVVTAEKRTVAYQGHIITDYRILAKRKKADQKTLGWSEIEMIFDGQRYLPLTFRTRYLSPKDQAFELDWTSRWGPQKFAKSVFDIPNSVVLSQSNQ